MKLTTPPIHERSGSMLVLSLILLLALGGMTAALSVLNLRMHKEHEHAREDLRAFCTAEGGLNEAYAVLLESGIDDVRALEYPRETGASSYQAAFIDGRDDTAIDLDHVRLRCVGAAGREPAGVQLMVWHVPTGPYQFAAFGARGVLLNSNVMVDSYDPDDGPYPDDVEFVNDFGNVGSFETVAIDANVSIHGDALVGPDGAFDDDAPGVRVSGEMEAREISVEMAAVAVPSFPSKGVLPIMTSYTIPPGNHHYRAVAVNAGKLKIVGPATLVVDDFLMRSNTQLVIDATLGAVKIFATGDFELRSNSTVTTNTARARDVEVVITSSNLTGGATIALKSNSEFMGTIYAPDARLELSSNFTVFGAVKADFVELASNSAIHFDEDLLYDPAAADVFERVSWRRLSPVEVAAELEAAALP
jgi:hypothetical protein